MKSRSSAVAKLRHYRNSKLYRSLGRTFRAYNRSLLAGLRARGFDDFSPAYPQILSNLDTEGTRIGVLALRAGITRQAAGQLIAEIERCGYVQRRSAKGDARATVISFTAKGRRMLETVFELVEELETGYAAHVGADAYARLQRDLARIADAIDPEGSLGAADE